MRLRGAAAWKRDEGQALVEYSLILALVAAGLALVLLLFRDTMGNAYGTVGNQVDAAGLPVTAPGGRSGGGSPGGAGGGGEGKGRHGCGGGQGGGYGRGGGGGCGDGRKR
jgi:Flp pilus assembly pilin Flp